MSTRPHPAAPGTIRDGAPHLAYYDAPSHLSFVWTGHLEDPIHVQAGGYGEPTIAQVDVTATYPGGHDSPAELFAWFQATCDTWNAAWPGESDPQHPDDTEDLDDPDDSAAPLLVQPSGRCTHRLGGGPLGCTNTTVHQPGAGCIYVTESWVDDRHHDGGHG